MPRFGTDGVRGVANSEVTPELAIALGRSAARVLRPATGDRARWVIGRDTRQSGSMLTAALAAGLASEGTDVVDLGVLATPAVAHTSAVHAAPAAMISASHNPFADNGIKLFAPGGRKLDDATEQRIEKELSTIIGVPAAGIDGVRPGGRDVGTVIADPSLAGGYEGHLAAALEGRRLAGTDVVLDCANGAASRIGPSVMRGLGADVSVIHDQPDGSNINDRCGSTFPQDLQAAVLAHRADVGLALDGDADRVLAVNSSGTVLDGDQLIAMCAIDMHQRGVLRHDTVVVTVMTNLGFRIAMEERGIHVVETMVGDRAILEAMAQGKYNLGGEQSGHIIFGDLATTGDGVLTGLWILDLVRRSGRTLAELADSAMVRLPQVLLNVRVPHPHADVADRIVTDIAAATAALGDRGRALVRPSGTEPLVRVMVEAPSEEQARAVAERLVAAVEATCST